MSREEESTLQGLQQLLLYPNTGRVCLSPWGADKMTAGPHLRIGNVLFVNGPVKRHKKRASGSFKHFLNTGAVFLFKFFILYLRWFSRQLYSTHETRHPSVKYINLYFII